MYQYGLISMTYLIWNLYFVWLQSQNCAKCYANQTGPIPLYKKSSSTLYGFTIWKKTLVWLIELRISISKSKVKTVWLRNHFMLINYPLIASVKYGTCYSYFTYWEIVLFNFSVSEGVTDFTEFHITINTFKTTFQCLSR